MKNEIRVHEMAGVGSSAIVALDLGISDDVTIVLNSGAPYKWVLREAERLAMIIDCDLCVNSKRVRERIGD